MDWQWVHPDSLKMASPFRGLFPQNRALEQTIADDLEVHGFDPAFPIVVWDGIVIDGHTRLIAAREQGLHQVAVIRKAFDSVRDALEYAVHCQRDRRNLSNEGLMNAIAAIDAKYREQAAQRQKDLAGSRPRTSPSKEGKVGRGESAGQTAEALGVSRSTVERVRAIENDNTPPEIKQKVRSGEVSITKGAEMARAARKPAPTKPERPKQRFIGHLGGAINDGEAYAAKWQLREIELHNLKASERLRWSTSSGRRSPLLSTVSSWLALLSSSVRLSTKKAG